MTNNFCSILVAIFCFLFVFEAKAQKLHKYNNIVKIAIGEGEGQGFGFIVFEENDTLYIVTARHVVQTDYEIPISVFFYQDNIERRAVLVNLHPTLDIGLIKTVKPDKYFVWEFRGYTTFPKKKDKIEIIGRYDTWMPLSRKHRGEIIQCGEDMFVASFYGAAMGSSGGPILVKNKIVGMITHDLGGQIYAVPIQIIEKTICEWINLNPDSIKDLPLLGFGINMGVSTREVIPSRYTLLIDRSNDLLSFRPGVYFEIAPFQKTSFSVEACYRQIFKTTNTKYNPDIQFKNNYFSYFITLNRYFSSILGNAAAITDMEDPILPKIFLGYSMNIMNPKIKFENTDWELLDDQFGVLPNFSKKINSIFAGVGTALIVNKYGLYMEVVYEHYFSRYLFFNIIEPTHSNTNNNWTLSVNLKIGLIIRPKSSSIKFLR